MPRHSGGQRRTSTRTRSAFEVAAYDQGAHVTYLDPSGSQLGHKESIADTAAVLGHCHRPAPLHRARHRACGTTADPFSVW